MSKFLPLLCLGWAALAQAGVRVESQVTAYEGQPIDTVLELQGESFRIDRHSASEQGIPNSTIFDGERMLLVSAKNKTYTEMTLADLKAQMEKLLQLKAGLPPEAQKELDRQGAPPAYTFKESSGGEKVAGISCKNFQIKKDNANQGTACLAEWKASGLLTKADLAPMRNLIESMKSMSRLSAGDLEMGQFDQWPGWPLVMRAPDGHELSRVTKISRITFPASDFKPPPDFKLESVPQMMGGPHP
jgi:hypothetical protein